MTERDAICALAWIIRRKPWCSEPERDQLIRIVEALAPDQDSSEAVRAAINLGCVVPQP